MEFLSLSHRRSSALNVPSGEERGGTVNGPVNGQPAWEKGNRKLPCGRKGVYDRMTDAKIKRVIQPRSRNA